MSSPFSRRSMLGGSAAMAAVATLGHLPGTRTVQAQGAATYDIVDFGPMIDGVQIPGASRLVYGNFKGITSDGTSFGRMAVSAEKFSPAIWSADGKIKRLKSGKYGGIVNGVNAGGDAAGQLYVEINGGKSQALNKAAAWLNGELVELPLPDPEYGDPSSSAALGISDDGVIVGSGNGYSRLRWIDGQPEILAAPDDTSVSDLAIGATGSIAATTYFYGASASPARASRLIGTTFVSVEPPDELSAFSSYLAGINGKDVLLTRVSTPDVYLTVLYDGDASTMLDLRKTGESFYGMGLNDNNDVVGLWQEHAFQPSVPAIWQGKGPTALNALMPSASGLTLNSVQGIANDGSICGLAIDETFVQHLVVLVPAT